VPQAIPDRHVLHVALECRPGREYDEGAFHYFLAVERSRAYQSNHALRLLLVSVEPAPGKPVLMGRATAVRLFAGLRLSLRETDIVGWYRQHHVAGAVLSVCAEAPLSDMSRLVLQRVGDELRRRLPSKVARSLRVRVIQLGRRFGN
jgi:hypothetical protein